jgi:benzodiazapine receptor
MKIEWIKLVLAIIICNLAGIIGSVFTFQNIQDWYNPILVKPSFAPPGSVIGIIWTILYFLMGVSLYLLWTDYEEKKDNRYKTVFMLFAVQLIMNAAWSFLFFEIQSPFSGLIGIVILWILIMATIIKVNEVNRNAALLLLPYILWVTFAGFLNFTIWQLNPY